MKNRKSNVYFVPVNAGESYESHSKKASKLLETLIQKEHISFINHLPVKIHFGEQGNVTYIKPEVYEKVIDLLQNMGSDPYFIETNVLYRGERTVKDSHLKLAQAHGFTRIPVVIADGELGTDSVKVDIHQKRFSQCKIGAGFAELDQMLVMSHFKGHMLAGFGGAIKQLAMGCAARGGKLDQHAGSCPVVREDKCTACGLCSDQCPVDAIGIKQSAVIDNDLCIGCAGCIAVCPENALTVNWMGLSSSHFYENIAEYAFAVKTLINSMVFINFAVSITQNCDCDGQKMKPIVRDLGIFASLDPVSVDKACLDELEKRENREVFPGKEIFDYAHDIGLGNPAYNLILI